MYKMLHRGTIYIYIYMLNPPPPPNGPTAGGSRVLARSREKQQNKKLTKSKKPKKQKSHLFQNYGAGASKRWFFLVFSRKRWFFFGSKPSFSREKDGFWRSSPGKTIFFSRKRWFYQKKKPSFSREKGTKKRKRWFPSFSRENQKKPSFGGTSPIVLEKMFFFFWFFGFLEKKMVFWLETIVFSRKRWF